MNFWASLQREFLDVISTETIKVFIYGKRIYGVII